MIHLHQSSNGEFYFTVVAKNGNVLCTSETYKRRDGALNGAEALMRLLQKLNDPFFD